MTEMSSFKMRLTVFHSASCTYDVDNIYSHWWPTYDLRSNVLIHDSECFVEEVLVPNYRSDCSCCIWLHLLLLMTQMQFNILLSVLKFNLGFFSCLIIIICIYWMFLLQKATQHTLYFIFDSADESNIADFNLSLTLIILLNEFSVCVCMQLVKMWNVRQCMFSLLL